MRGDECSLHAEGIGDMASTQIVLRWLCLPLASVEYVIAVHITNTSNDIAIDGNASQMLGVMSAHSERNVNHRVESVAHCRMIIPCCTPF